MVLASSTTRKTQTFSVPVNFSLVEKGIYRSAYPEEKHVPGLRQLGIKTIALLSIEVLPANVLRLLEGKSSEPEISNHHELVNSFASSPAGGNPPSNDGNLYSTSTNTSHSIGLSVTPIRVISVANLQSWLLSRQSVGDDFSVTDVHRALHLTAQENLHPLLLACPTGELQTSVVVGCLRRHQNVCLSSILSECELFSPSRNPLRSSLVSFIDSWNPEDHRFHDSLQTIVENSASETQSDPTALSTANEQEGVASSPLIALWYRRVMAYQRDKNHLSLSLVAPSSESRPSGKGMHTGSTTVLPHKLYALMRNPPSLSPYSSFNSKLSTIEDVES